MKAIVYSNSGQSEVLQLRDVATPAPKDHEVLIRIHATTVMATGFGSDASWSRQPKHPSFVIPGQDLAGEVEAVGRKVTRFRKGDQILAWTGLRLGTFAEYICLPERGTLFTKPANMTYAEAATLPVGGLDAIYLLRQANIQPGERVLVNGAGGSMGTYAVQIAKRFGAEVTSVDSAAKLDMLRSIGTDNVIDYNREDFIQSGETYDVIFDVIGKHSFSDILNRLNLNGRYVTAVPQLSQIFRWQWIAWRRGRKIVFWMPRTVTRQADDFAFIKDLIEAGTVKAVIDKCYSLEQTAEAHQYVESGNKLGHVVVTVT
jgi:NADPH:quinone reductase-like Zn-dependent oxidoreductase